MKWIYTGWFWTLSFVAIQTAHAQTLTVESASTLDALPGAVITDPASGRVLVTDDRGQADLSDLSDATELRITCLGYTPVTITPGGPGEQDLRIHLEESAILLDVVPVTATRWSEPMARSPQPLSVVRPGEIRLQNPPTAADAIGLSGQVFVQKSQLGGGSPMVRGFAANRVLISVDGVRMNTAIFRSGNLQNVIALDALVLDRIEILQGPGSLLYGSDAIGGVMRMNSRPLTLIPDGDSFLRGQAFLRFASASQEKTVHLDLHYGRGRWAFLTSATHTDFDDLRMGRQGPEAYLRPSFVRRVDGRDSVFVNPDPEIQVGSGYAQLNLMQKVRFRPSDRWDLGYAFHVSTTSDVPRYDRLIRPRGQTLRSAEWTYGPQDWQMHLLQADHHAGASWADDLRITAAWQAFGESRRDRDLNTPIRYIRKEAVDAWSLNLDARKSWSDSRFLFYGAESVYNLVSSTGTDENVETATSVPGPGRYPDGSTWSSLAAYGLYQWRPSERWQVEGGLRVTRIGLKASFDPTFYAFPFEEARQRNTGLTGNLGILCRPGPGWQFSLQGSSGFRSPNVDDIGKVFDSTPGSVVVPNPDIRPETAWSGDLGITRTIGERIRVDAHLWGTRLVDALVRRDFTFNGQDSLVYDGELSRVQAIQNAAVARVWGIQGSVEAVLGSGLRLRVRTSWQAGEEELDDGSTAPLRHSAPWTALGQLTWQTGAWQTDLSWQWQAEVSAEDLPPDEQGKEYLYAVDKDGQPYAPAWSVLNLKAVWQPTEALAIHAGIENILDLRYRPYSSGITAPGRNVILGARISF